MSESACAYSLVGLSSCKSVNFVVIKSIDDEENVDEVETVVIVSLRNSSSSSSISSIRPSPILDIDRAKDGR